MEKIFTVEMRDTLKKARREVTGTLRYNKYDMCVEFKYKNRWKYCGWYIPVSEREGIIKRINGKTYIIFNQNVEYPERYEVTDAVAQLLEL